ncbi:MAG TPA: deaminase [Gemmataceae bacterium]|nr:deaminase [Gemmataceae bacterium]
MSNDRTHDLARQRLTELAAPTKAMGGMRADLLEYRPIPEHEDDAHAWLSCVLALEGVAAGNFGVGAILVEEGGRIAVQGHNEMFHPRFRSDRHAEMVVMDRWEGSDPGACGGTLVTSVEPCPMCLVRLSSSALRRVLYVAPDLTGGMVRRMDSLPPYWAEAARGKVFAQARCSPDLVRAAEQIFLLNLEELTAHMKAR